MGSMPLSVINQSCNEQKHAGVSLAHLVGVPSVWLLCKPRPPNCYCLLSRVGYVLPLCVVRVRVYVQARL